MKNIKHYLLENKTSTKQANALLDMYDNKSNDIKECWLKACNNDPNNLDAVIYGLKQLEQEDYEDYSYVIIGTLKELLFK